MRQNLRPLTLLPALLLILLLSGCLSSNDDSDNDDSNDDSNNVSSELERGELLSYNLLSTHSQASINLVVQLLGIDGNYSASYDVDSYKITYRTLDVSGAFIEASGLLSVPKKLADQTSPMISYQHGTIFEDSSAPSNSATVSDKPILVASQGFIVSSPDYLGFGTTNNILHPYLHGETLASATVDMARASKLFLQEQGISLSDELFLMGYSEGGYATLATHKKIQETHGDEFQVVASFPGAGPYDMNYSAQTLLSDTMAYPAYVALTFKAYNEVYQLDRLDEIFTSTYVDTVDTVFDGSKSGVEINNLLTTDPEGLIQAEFLADFLGDGEQGYKTILDDNSLVTDWLPESPVFFYHGEEDKIVPYKNAELALETMLSTGVVSLTSCSGVTVTGHSECSLPFALFSLTVMKGMTANL